MTIEDCYCPCGNWWPYAGKCEVCQPEAPIVTHPDARVDRLLGSLILALAIILTAWTGAAFLWAVFQWVVGHG